MYAEINVFKLMNAFEVFLQFVCRRAQIGY